MLETFRLQLESAIKYRMESYARALNTLGTEGSVNWSRVQPRANARGFPRVFEMEWEGSLLLRPFPIATNSMVQLYVQVTL